MEDAFLLSLFRHLFKNRFFNETHWSWNMQYYIHSVWFWLDSIQVKDKKMTETVNMAMFWLKN